MLRLTELTFPCWVLVEGHNHAGNIWKYWKRCPSAGHMIAETHGDDASVIKHWASRSTGSAQPLEHSKNYFSTMNDNTETTTNQVIARTESLVDSIATIIQAGHRDRKTSHEVAVEVVASLSVK